MRSPASKELRITNSQTRMGQTQTVFPPVVFRLLLDALAASARSHRTARFAAAPAIRVAICTYAVSILLKFGGPYLNAKNT